ncbi:hypothetical protein DFH09DRAFT_548850 [Mycena vulgaris]|nr:hypothetical protein DFH09DRAFT_548850 [Mycena vulgaris]
MSKPTHHFSSSMGVVSSSLYSLYPIGKCSVYALAMLSYFPTGLSSYFSDCPTVCESGIFSSAVLSFFIISLLFLSPHAHVLAHIPSLDSTTPSFMLPLLRLAPHGNLVFCCIVFPSAYFSLLTSHVANLHDQFLVSCEGPSRSRCRVPATGILGGGGFLSRGGF